MSDHSKLLSLFSVTQPFLILHAYFNFEVIFRSYLNNSFSFAYSDSCGSNSPSVFEPPFTGGHSRSNSPESDLSGLASPDGSLYEVLVSLLSY